jgi:hypothetical protein
MAILCVGIGTVFVSAAFNLFLGASSTGAIGLWIVASLCLVFGLGAYYKTYTYIKKEEQKREQKEITREQREKARERREIERHEHYKLMYGETFPPNSLEDTQRQENE